MLVGWRSSRVSCGALWSVSSRWLCISRNCVHPGELPLLAAQSLSPKEFFFNKLRKYLRLLVMLEQRNSTYWTVKMFSILITTLYNKKQSEAFWENHRASKLYEEASRQYSVFVLLPAYVCTQIHIQTSDHVAIFHTARSGELCKQSSW